MTVSLLSFFIALFNTLHDMGVSGHTHERSHSMLPLLPYSDAAPSSTQQTRSRSFLFQAHRRRTVLVAGAFISIIALFGLAATSVSRSSGASRYVVPDRLQDTSNPPTYPALDNSSHPGNGPVPLKDVGLPLEAVEEVEEVHPVYSPYLKGPPTESFRSNLRGDLKYITSWISAGWSVYKLLYFSNVHVLTLSVQITML